MALSSLYIRSFGRGALIGASSALFLLLDGRIAGISGIAGSLLRDRFSSREPKDTETVREERNSAERPAIPGAPVLRSP
jgi:hypothetical protein